jgi:hypothetical protein
LLLEQEQASRFVVVRMEVQSREYRYLVFLSPLDSRDSWRFAGYADTFSHYGTPSHRLETAPNGTYLVVTHNIGGSGAYDRRDSWYELSPEHSSEVLNYPTQGYDDPFLMGKFNGEGYGLSRRWESKRADQPDDPTVRIELTVKYAVNEDAGTADLFSKTQTAVFVWDGGSRTYKLDEKVSGMTRLELDTVYKIDAMERLEFIKYNFDALRQITEEGSAARNAWLRSLLIDAGADPQAADLLRRIR